MKVKIRSDSVTIEGYVNATERLSKPLMSRIGMFLERIRSGAFGKAIKRNDDIHCLLNHDWERDLASTKRGNLELEENSIGLYARACITDPDVIEKARNGDLVGWSFGFQDREVEQSVQDGLPLRDVMDMDLFEVSILDRSKSPAYTGTLIQARSEDDVHYIGDALMDDVQIEEERDDSQPEQEEPPVAIDYTLYEQMISDMKGEKK